MGKGLQRHGAWMWLPWESRENGKPFVNVVGLVGLTPDLEI